MYRNLQEWFLRRLDSLLTEEQRRLPPDELSRLRVLVGAAALNLVMAVSNMVGPEAPAHGTLFRAVGVVFSASYLSTLVLVRRGSSPRLPGLILCATLTVGIALATRLVGNPQLASHATIMLAPFLAVYLLGARLGFVFTAVMMLNVLLLNPLSWGGGLSGRPFFMEEHTRFAAIAGAISLLGGWVLSWLHSSSRQEAHAALREREGQLVSLIESTDDLVCSFDAQGRTITANRAVRKWVHQLTEGESTLSEALFRQLLPERQAFWREQLARALSGQSLQFEVSTSPEGGSHVLDIRLNPIFGAEGKTVGVTLFGRDITTRKEAEERLGTLHRSMLEVSRQAGKAEIAMSVLHNVGNTLNSVTVSVGLVAERARSLRLSGVAGAARLLRERAQAPGLALSDDVRGQQIPTYLQALSEQLLQEQAALVKEVDALRVAVEHIQAVVVMQQEHARPVGLLEQVPVPQLLDDALRLQGLELERAGIQVRTQYASVPPLMVDRHKLLQILTHLLSNARYALGASVRQDKQLTLRVELPAPNRLRIEVTDNGVGILPEHLPRLFTQGFTTREVGHGFGLHLSSLAAMELGGSLTCASQGKEQGATFTLELPLEPEPADA